MLRPRIRLSREIKNEPRVCQIHVFICVAKDGAKMLLLEKYFAVAQLLAILYNNGYLVAK